MRQIKMDDEEKQILKDIKEGKYLPVGGEELRTVADSIIARKKNMTLTMRVNKQDISRIKKFSQDKGIPYQTYLSEVIHRVAQMV